VFDGVDDETDPADDRVAIDWTKKVAAWRLKAGEA
jgi:hypothetical protein